MGHDQFDFPPHPFLQDLASIYCRRMDSNFVPLMTYFPQWSSPAGIQNQAMVARCGVVATGVVWLWDSLICIPEDVKLFKGSRFTFTDAVCILSRITTFGFLILATILFAVTFTFLWLAVIAGAFVQPFCADFAAIGISDGCIATVVKPYCTSGIVVVMVHDTLVLLAISSRLLVYSLADSWSDRFKVFFSGRGMPHISRLLMQTGQLYYMVTAVVNVFTVVVIFTPSVSPIYRSTIVLSNLMVCNLMASHVYRKVKLGVITDGTTMPFSVSASGSAPLRFASFTLKT